MPFEKKENTGKILMIAALTELPILAAGVYQFTVTDNVAWIIGAVVLGAAVIMIPAMLRIMKIQERDNASR